MPPFRLSGLIAALLLIPLGAMSEVTPATPPALTIGSLECPDHENPGQWQSKSCRIDDEIRATVNNLSDWREGETGKLEQLVLSVNGHKLTDVTPAYYSLSSPTAGRKDQSGATNTAEQTAQTYYLSYFLRYTDKNRINWRDILKRYNPFGKSYVVVEIADKNPGNTYGGISIELKVASNFRIMTAILIFSVVLLVLVCGAAQGHFLREIGPTTAAKPKNSFSLASTQMALWFIIIFGSFIYLWMVTGDIDTLTPGVLMLAGISAGTGLTATAITANNQNNRIALSAKEVKLTSEIKALDSLESDATPEHKAVLDKLNKQLKTVAADLTKLPEIPKPDTTANFFTDLLRTEGEVTFSRLQIVGWTLILAVVFLHSVFADLAMPEFSATLLGLMGISGGTYVGFKFPKPPTVLTGGE